MCLGKRKIVMKAFPTFGYCRLVWMVHTKRWEQTLGIKYGDKSSSFRNLL